jgi:hypothetical protein
MHAMPVFSGMACMLSDMLQLQQRPSPGDDSVDHNYDRCHQQDVNDPAYNGKNEESE